MRARHAILMVLAALLAAPAPAFAESESVTATVQQLDDSLLALMKARGSLHAREMQIAPAIERAFDLPLMMRLSVGPGWTAIAPADQQALLAAFRRLTVAQYAANFDQWSGESFTIAPNVEARGTDRLVRTTLGVPGKEAVAISYRLREIDGRWRIIDIFYRNAISQIALRRSDFAAVLAKGGARALTAHLDSLSAKGRF